MLYIKNNVDIDKLCENWEHLSNGNYKLTSCCSDESIVVNTNTREVYADGYTGLISEWYRDGIIIENHKDNNNCLYDPYKIVCLCGSTKFKKRFLKAAERLTLEGAIVLMPFVFLGVDNINIDSDQMSELLKLHKEKIAMADIIYIITDETKYIGRNTKDEIEYAKKLGKTIKYYEFKF